MISTSCQPHRVTPVWLLEILKKSVRDCRTFARLHRLHSVPYGTTTKDGVFTTEINASVRITQPLFKWLDETHRSHIQTYGRLISAPLKSMPLCALHSKLVTIYSWPQCFGFAACTTHDIWATQRQPSTLGVRPDVYARARLMVRLQEILSGSIYRNSFKNREELWLVFTHFSSAIMNDLTMTFISRLKMDAKSVYQQWHWVDVANYFGTPPADWVHGYLCFEPGAWIWTKGFRRYLHVVKNDLQNFL